MADLSPYQQVRQIDHSVVRFGASVDWDEQTSAGRRAFEMLRRNARAAQDILKDYEMFELEEDTLKQVQLLPRVIKALEKLRESLLKASEYDLVSAIDVAQLSAQLDELIDRLR